MSGGNIGTPFCEYILAGKKQELIILELSSFQLEGIKTFAPHMALLLNISLNHGERYAGLEDYAQAKFRITLNMGEDDVLVFARDGGAVEDWAGKCKMHVQGVELADIKTMRQWLEQTFSLEKFKLIGDHNIINLAFCWHVGLHFGLETKKVQHFIDNFNGVEHRLEFVPSDLPFAVYNDAKSTNWNATLAALQSFDLKRPLRLVVGGKKRGREDEISPILGDLKGVEKLYLIGETGDDHAGELEGQLDFEAAGTLEKVLESLKSDNFQGDLLFSPGFPSFDQFKNYGERGRHFKRLFGKKST